ncbi:DUF3087 family protein [Thalassotalea piscium]|uniref:DUF3087 domain-containing protein n=1 Tax=Thalassotalea piscium TaxID=1230533 RepID=A0A7X0NGU6_9GAMM|nr:DUF3087 family protein [Thalassotalea piscium]MBB6543204.1 hypothetical protein [Thalassotalea piscium]
MNIKHINKSRYRKHLNQVIIGFIATLAILSLLFGAVFIQLFGVTPEQIANGESNFRFNLLGVVLALMVCSAILYKVRLSDYFTEIFYVWQVKQVQNLIYRKLRKIKAAADNNNENALIILHYYYESLIQVYQLDDNTITLTELTNKQQALHQKIEDNGLTITSSQFDKVLLKEF